MSIDKITSPAKPSITNTKINEIIDAHNGYETSFSTDDLTAPVIKGDDIVTLTSDPTNGTGVVVITPNAFTYKDSNSNVKDVGFKDDIYYKAGDTFTASGVYCQVPACVTSGQTTLQFNIPLPKQIPSTLTPRITSLGMTGRSGNGGYIISNYTLSDADSVAASHVHGNTIWTTVTSSTKYQSITNNTALVLVLSDVTIEFS